jgi:hypothetical protein
MQAICCGRRAAANFWYLLRLGRLQYFISQFCNTKNLLRPQKKWLKISLSVFSAMPRKCGGKEGGEGGSGAQKRPAAMVLVLAGPRIHNSGCFENRDVLL